MNKANFSNLPVTEYLWNDRKRWLGLPWTFTRYRLSDDRLFLETGFFNRKTDEILLYRVRDLSLSISFGQRLFGVGTVCIVSSDKSLPHLDLKNVKYPAQVKELIHQKVEQAKEKRRMKSMEIMDGGSFDHDSEDFDPDDFDN